MVSHTAGLLALASSSFALAAMLVLGVAKGMLNRTSLRLCPSCGRYIRNGHCACL
jgi:hypothetical protein